MSLATTKWPLRQIIWGIWFNSFNSFLNVRNPQVKDQFDTWEDANKYRTAKFTPREIQKQGIIIKPIRRIGQNEITTEDI